MGIIEKQITQCRPTKTPVKTVNAQKSTIKLIQGRCFDKVKLVPGIQK